MSKLKTTLVSSLKNANDDGIIDNTDPVFNQLKIWKDANHNGAVEDGERGLLSYYGITRLNYEMGTFTITQNGQTQTRQMASTDLTADTQGTRATVVPEGILLQTSNGEITLIVTKIEDESHLNVNQDRISIVEDTASVVTAADRMLGTWQGRVANDDDWRVAA
jgi:hypothetical protein